MARIITEKDSKTNVQISRATRNALADLGKKDDTFDDVIRMLLEFYLEHQ